MRKLHRLADVHTHLLLRARGGDADAFAEFYAALRPVVRDFIASLDGQSCQHEYEDLVQEVFVRVWEKPTAYRQEASAKTFILSIAKNIVLKHKNTQSRPPIVRQDDLTHVLGREQAGSCGPDVRELAQAIEEAMAELTEVQREAIDLAVIRGIPRPQASRLAKCSANQFANRLRRATITLRRLLSSLQCILL